MWWSAIRGGDCDSAAPAKIKKAFAGFAARLEKLASERAAVSRRVSDVKAGSLSAETIGEMSEIKTSRLVLWQAELDWIRDFEKWVMSEYVPAIRKVKKDAFAAIRQAAQDVTQKLVGIGYVTVAKQSMYAPGKITTGMIMSHPLHIAAVSREKNLESHIGAVIGLRKFNMEEGEKTLREINRLKAEMTAVA